jgi:hypothetical protein
MVDWSRLIRSPYLLLILDVFSISAAVVFTCTESVGPLLWVDLPRQRAPQLLVGSRVGLSYRDFFHCIFPASSFLNNTIIIKMLDGRLHVSSFSQSLVPLKSGLQ